uniref:Uncharacterized protein n=1 Tax=Anopheles atroparvus TaxID=41427 RepID=A0A182JHJ4_ANOAO
MASLRDGDRGNANMAVPCDNGASPEACGRVLCEMEQPGPVPPTMQKKTATQHAQVAIFVHRGGDGGGVRRRRHFSKNTPKLVAPIKYALKFTNQPGAQNCTGDEHTYVRICVMQCRRRKRGNSACCFSRSSPAHPTMMVIARNEAGLSSVVSALIGILGNHRRRCGAPATDQGVTAKLLVALGQSYRLHVLSQRERDRDLDQGNIVRANGATVLLVHRHVVHPSPLVVFLAVRDVMRSGHHLDEPSVGVGGAAMRRSHNPPVAQKRTTAEVHRPDGIIVVVPLKGHLVWQLVRFRFLATDYSVD